MENPYAPPPAEELPETAISDESDLESATTYLRRMGYLAMTYYGMVACAVSADLLNKSKFNADFRILILIYAVCMLVLITYLTMRASELSDKPQANLRLCRVFAIILGALFCPFLTLPAFFVVKYLRRWEL